MPVESHRTEPPTTLVETPLRLQMFGPLAIERNGVSLPLPASRKVRALLAYLALAPRPVARGSLCELLWDVPNDPRGELRWSLSKIRGIVDEPGRRRVVTTGDSVALDLEDCAVDAIEVARAMDAGIADLGFERQHALSQLFRGEFLEGLEIDRNPAFGGWLVAQRRRFRGCHAALLAQLVAKASEDEVFGYLERWLQLAPFDRRVHQTLLTAFADRNRVREGEEHLAATARLFEAEGLDWSELREAWQSARSQATRTHRVAGAQTPAAIGAAGSAVTVETSAEAIAPSGAITPAAARRASIAVMPFADESAAAGARGGAADALAHDVITRLAKLRSMFVIAQGTVFSLHERRIGPEEAGRILGVDYVVGGSVRRQGARLDVAVELSETRTARIVWTETFNRRVDDAFAVLDEIGNRIVASIASEIETIERNRAILRPPSSLDAWEAYHRGLWHMYRFDRTDNERARHFFATALRLDPTFARAYAGLSFTHFQGAFQGWEKPGPEIDRAYDAAGQSLMADERDPAAHWAMGRALWLRGQHEPSVVALERAIDLSPNFALGHYTLAFVHSQAGDPDTAIAASDHSRELSPFDPLLFGMLGARAMALVRLGRFSEAANWATKAAARPNAHPHIVAIAAFSLALAGSLDEARTHAATVRRTLPQYRLADFLRAFRFDPDGEALFREGAKRLGMA
jgi:DNA-binding SARP family transcriptional activator/TolB-like protein